MKYSGIRAFENYKDSKTSKNRRKSATGAKIGLLQLPGSGCDTRGAGWPSKIPPGDPVPGSGTRRAAAGGSCAGIWSQESSCREDPPGSCG